MKVDARGFWGGLNPSLKRLVFLLISIGGIGFALSICLFVLVGVAGGVFSLPFCFRDDCFILFFSKISSAVYLTKLTVDLIVFVATIGGIVVALLSYLSSMASSRFANHISHLTLFQAFFVEEVKKRDALVLSSFDIHKLYSMIYEGSRSGVMTVSSSYISFVGSLNSVIAASNLKATKAYGGAFIYQEHQARMIAVLKQLGFSLQHMPKKDFYEIETQVLSLLDSVNGSFCGSLDELVVHVRIYR
ncbi:retron Ec48 family effector membrane protein [Pseudomonas sp. Pseusp11]|uniref:retron Ec48 family effector membrane protein n=1 Tax=Pseudomonas sp. Pseusp11 TaxID=3243003 RepID=UPI0039B3CF68